MRGAQAATLDGTAIEMMNAAGLANDPSVLYSRRSVLDDASAFTSALTEAEGTTLRRLSTPGTL